MNDKENFEELHEQYIAPTYGSRELTIVKGEGVYLYDNDGKKYIDCMSNFGVNILGHNNQEINEAIQNQLLKLSNLHGSFVNDQRSIFAKKLVEAPPGLSKVFFCNSGAEAIEAAIKFSTIYNNKSKFLSAKMGYHGKTTGSLSLTNTLPKYKKPFLNLLLNTDSFSYNDIESFKEVLDDDVGAIFIEVIQGESGIRPADKEFLTDVQKICNERNILFIVDEIQTGMGRTGKLFASDLYDLKPDMITLAKGICAGLPAAALLINEKISEKLYKGCHTNTFGGNPLISAAGIATLNYIDEHNLFENATDVGNYFITELKKIESSLVREIRGVGLMIAIELKVKCSKYAKLMQDKGLLVIPTGSTVLRLLPPIIFSKENVDESIEIKLGKKIFVDEVSHCCSRIKRSV